MNPIGSINPMASSPLTRIDDATLPKIGLAPSGAPGAAPTDGFTKMLDGRNTYIIDAIERALGRKPGDFTDYAKTTAATGFWSDRHV